MIALIYFIAIWLGINIVKFPILIAIIGILISIYTFKKIGKKHFLVFIILFFISSLIIVLTRYLKPIYNNEYGIIILSKDNYFIYWNNFTRYYVYLSNNPYQIGDLIKINGKVNEFYFSSLESGFNFNSYLNNKGIFYQIENPKITDIFIFPFRLKNFKDAFLLKFNSANRPFIESLIFATSVYDDQFIQTMSSMHLYRLMSTSGLFINAILDGIIFIVSLKIKEKYAKIIGFSFLSIYLIFTLFKFSILRLCYLFILKWINEYVLKNKFTYLALLSISGISFLIINPFLAFQDSFNLGYLISLFIYFIRNSFNFLSKFKLNILIIFLINLFFIPFEAQYYQEISLFSFIIVNLLSPFLIIIGVVLLLCFYMIPIFSVANYLISGFKNTIYFLNPYMLNIHVNEMNIYLTLIYFCILVIVLYIFSLKFKPFYGASLFYISFLLIYFLPLKAYIFNQVTFINVGQGDSTYIRYNNKNILIDTGGSLYQDIANECLIPFFKKNQIYSLDYVIITHNDFDHNGALENLKNNFNVKNIIDSSSKFPLYIDDLIISNLNNHISNYSQDNEKSLVLSFEINETDFLIMGDAPIKIENYIINEYPNLQCDILKVGHHGSSTSTSQNFIEFLRPKEAIISCGLNNQYNHPDLDVLNILKYYDVKIHRTDLQFSKTYYFL